MDDADTRPGDPFAVSPGCALAAVRLSLTNFRSYGRAELRVDALPVVLAGANGSGKTNLLEAISLLSPGRGLRGAKLSAVQRRAPGETPTVPDDVLADSSWAVSATIARGRDGCWELGTGLLPSLSHAPARRALHLNGAPAESA